MWRHWGGGNGGSRQFLATGKDWKDPSSYVQHQTELFPDLGAAGTEDQYLYQVGPESSLYVYTTLLSTPHRTILPWLFGGAFAGRRR